MRRQCQFTVKRSEKRVDLTVAAAASKEISFGAVCYGSERYANQINAKKQPPDAGRLQQKTFRQTESGLLDGDGHVVDEPTGLRTDVLPAVA